MDVSLVNNVLEGTRQYFMGVPKPAQAEGSGQPVWPTGAPLPEEGAPARSGAPAHSSRPPSAAAAPPSVPSSTPVPTPPRPPSEPLEPEPHIIHKATVMREAAEKRREQPDIEDEEDPGGALSPPSHIIRKPQRTLPSPAPAPAAPCPSPARPPSNAPLPPPSSATEHQMDTTLQYRASVHCVQTPTSRPADHFAPGRPPDPYSTSRPPEPYARYHYEANSSDSGRNSHGPIASPQPSTHARHSPQTYARLSSSVPQHGANRLRDIAAHNPPAQRFQMQAVQPPPLPNDRVPPIHHPPATPSTQRHSSLDSRQAQMYSNLQQRREPSPYSQASSSHYNRHPAIPQRKYDHQQGYPGYRPTPGTQPVQSQRVDTHYQAPHKHATLSAHYTTRPQEPHPPQPHDTVRLVSSRPDYSNTTRSVDPQSNYHYQVPSTSTSRYGPSTSVPVVQNVNQPRSVYRTAPKQGYEHPAAAPVQTSPARSSLKPGYANPQRMTVSVTSLVDQWNQTKQKQEVPASHANQPKQKRESPLDLSVKTVKNSADSSTTQDDAIDSATAESKIMQLQHRPSSSNQHPHLPSGLKIDFAPNFSPYPDRSSAHTHAVSTHPSSRYNGTYEPRRPIEAYPVESPNSYHDRDIRKYSVPNRSEHVPKIDLTRPVPDQHHVDTGIRDDRHIIIEERKRPAGPIVSNIPKKIVRYETWSADSRIDQYQSREQLDLMKQPVYSFMSHRQIEAYQNEQKRSAASNTYREHSSHASHRYPNNRLYSHDVRPREPRDPSEYHAYFHEKSHSMNNHHQVIKKIPNHREVSTNHCDPHGRNPVDKSVLSILRNSLETKISGFVEPPRLAKQIPDLIVIDEDDSEIEITDLTKDNDTETIVRNVVKPSLNQIISNANNHIQMPKAVDSLPRDYEYNNTSPDPKRKSPDNDVASRIRTKAELKVMPPSQDNIVKRDTKSPEPEKIKLLPRKTHLFNQIRKDNLIFDSVIKNEAPSVTVIPEVKTEPMNIDEIEKDAEISIKTETILENLEHDGSFPPDTEPADDLDWASACDSFMEQLKSGCHKKKPLRKRTDTLETENDSKQYVENKIENSDNRVEVSEDTVISENVSTSAHHNKPVSESPVVTLPTITIKQEPLDEYEINTDNTELKLIDQQLNPTDKPETKTDKNKSKKSENKKEKDIDKTSKNKLKSKVKSEKNDVNNSITIKKEPKEKISAKKTVKEESDSDDDEPLIKSKIMKEKKESERLMKFQLLKDLSEKSAYVKLECCDVDVNKNTRSSIESLLKDKEESLPKGKLSRQSSRSKGKLSVDNNKNEKEVNSSSDSDDDNITVGSRLRLRKKTEDTKSSTVLKTPVKSSPQKKQQDNSSASNSSTPVRKPTFGDGSYFHPGWEDELYRYKRSLRMPTRLIAIPRGRSGGPFPRGSGALFTRGSTSLPDLDPAPLSPAPSSAQSAATDDLYARRPDKLTLDSDLDSNSSYSAPNKLHYDSEASTSTVLSSKMKRKGSSIAEALIQKYGPKENSKKDSKRNKSKDKEDKTPKIIPKKSNDLLPTPSLGLINNDNKGSCNVKKEKVMEGIFYLGAFRKETVTAYRNSFIKDTDGLIGATEEFSPLVLKSRTRTESRVLKQRATIKEVFGDERPASAPPSSCREEEPQDEKEEEKEVIKKEPEQVKHKLKPKKIVKDKLKRRSSSIRDGLRSTQSLKRNDAKGRLLRLKNRNSLMKSLNSKRMKGISAKHKSENTPSDEKEKGKEESSSLHTPEVTTKRRFKRLIGRRKLSSGFDYIRKKKKIIRREESSHKVRRPAPKPSPESVHDIKKEIKGWFINKSIGETHLHRAARLGYTDCVAYCLEKLEADPSAKDNAGFTPLHVAAARGHVRIARLLLQYGANVSAAAQGGIRPLHEACENSHMEVIRLLLSYGADPLLGTYAGQTPEELAEGAATALLRLHIADVQGLAVEPWRFPPPSEPIDREELGGDPLSCPPPASPPPPPDATIEIQCTEAPLPPFYSLRTAAGQPADGLWCLLQDITTLLQIKSKESLLKQIHCGSGSPKELLREIRTQEFLERAQCHQLLCAGEKVNVRASKVALVRVTDKLRQLLKIETVLVS